jgi:hypothetical protein
MQCLNQNHFPVFTVKRRYLLKKTCKHLESLQRGRKPKGLRGRSVRLGSLPSKRGTWLFTLVMPGASRSCCLMTM